MSTSIPTELLGDRTEGLPPAEGTARSSETKEQKRIMSGVRGSAEDVLDEYEWLLNLRT